jgi:hypothetical protein
MATREFIAAVKNSLLQGRGIVVGVRTTPPYAVSMMVDLLQTQLAEGCLQASLADAEALRRYAQREGHLSGIVTVACGSCVEASRVALFVRREARFPMAGGCLLRVDSVYPRIQWSQELAPYLPAKSGAVVLEPVAGC